MARPSKQGVDYFPLDVYLCKKFKFIEMKHGLAGFAITIKLYQYIYSLGYYADWDEDTCVLFADEIRADRDLVEEVVEECLERKIFHRGLYEQYGILTSLGIQKRYREIVRRRRGVEINPDYLLIDGDFGINEDTATASSKRNDGKNKPKENSKAFDEDSLEYSLANKLKLLIVDNNPNAKVPDNLQNWASVFDKMLRIDKRTVDDINKVMEFSQNDDFWYKNILSPGTLRKQFDRLYLQLKPKREEKKVKTFWDKE